MLASEIMRKCKAVSSDLSITEAGKLFDLHNVKIFPVLNNDRLVGIVTKGDIARALPSDANTLSKWEVHYWLDEVRIKGFMKDRVTISPDIALFELVDIARRKGFYNFPVAEKGILLGMVYKEDIFRHLADEARKPVLKIDVNITGQRPSFFKRLWIGGAP